jgi:hypothetical protein
MTVEEWTEEERDFLRDYRGGVFAILNDEPNAVGQAVASAEDVVRRIEGAYSNRMHRLVILQAIAKVTKDARDAILRELLEATFFIGRREDGTLATVAPDTYEVQHLAALAGCTTRTVYALYRKVSVEMFARYEAEHPTSPDPT